MSDTWRKSSIFLCVGAFLHRDCLSFIFDFIADFGDALRVNHFKKDILMPLIKKLSVRLQNHPKRLIYPDGEDLRVIKAAREFATRKLGVPILVGDKDAITAKAQAAEIRTDGIKIINPADGDDFEILFKLMSGLPVFRGIDAHSLRNMLLQPLYFSLMMLATNRCDAMVTGASVSTISSLRPIFQIISRQKGVSTVSSMMVLSTGIENLGIDGDLFLSDCGVVADPTADELCDIAITTAALAGNITLERPKIAMLSFVSKTPNPKNPSVLKVRAATALVHDRIVAERLDMEVDGELQVDAALRPEVAAQKGIASSVAGHANVLIFPDLNSGNITSKMLQITSSDVRCYGQILTGLVKPVGEVSRGATEDDIFGTSVIVGAQAVDRRFLSIGDLL